MYPREIQTTEYFSRENRLNEDENELLQNIETQDLVSEFEDMDIDDKNHIIYMDIDEQGIGGEDDGDNYENRPPLGFVEGPPQEYCPHEWVDTHTILEEWILEDLIIAGYNNQSVLSLFEACLNDGSINLLRISTHSFIGLLDVVYEHELTTDEGNQYILRRVVQEKRIDLAGAILSRYNQDYSEFDIDIKEGIWYVIKTTDY